MPQFLKPGAVAERLNVSKDSVYRWARDGVLPAALILRVGRSVRIDADALRDWLRQQRAGASV